MVRVGKDQVRKGLERTRKEISINERTKGKGKSKMKGKKSVREDEGDAGTGKNGKGRKGREGKEKMAGHCWL